MLAVLMQVIEDIEESVLVSLSLQILNVIHYEHVDLHIETEKISQFVVGIDSIHILSLELVSGNIENREFRMLLLDRVAYSLGKMGFSQSRPSENEQRIERGFARLAGNIPSGSNAEVVAFSVHQSAEAIIRVEPWVYLYLSVFLEHNARFPGCNMGWNRNWSVGGGKSAGTFDYHRWLTLYGADSVTELCTGAEFPAERPAEYVQECTLKVRPVIIGRNFYGKGRAHQGHSLYRLEPSGELLRLNVLLNNAQTTLPDSYVSFLFH